MPLDETLAALFGESADADDAEITPTADADEEGAPESDDALMALISPEDDAQDEDAEFEGEDESDEEEQPDYRALYEQSQSEILQERQRLQAEQSTLQQERQLQELRKANEAWQVEEQQVIAEASKAPNWEQAASKLIAYYRGREQKVQGAAQQLIQSLMAPQYAESVAKQAGLSEEDAALLRAVDPKFAPQLAQALAQKNAKSNETLQSIQDELKQLKRGRQSQRRAMTGRDRPSSNGGRPPVTRDFTDGSTDHLSAILRASQALKQR